MSYDLEILAKIENGQYICIDEPKAGCLIV